MAIGILGALPRIKGNPYLFPGKVKDHAIQNSIKAFKRIIKRAGLSRLSGCTISDILVASQIINNGSTIYDVEATLAHANIKISERYVHLSNERLQDTSDNLSVVAKAIGVGSLCDRVLFG